MNLQNIMMTRIQIAPIVLALGLVSGSAHATLQGRDLNGSASSFEAYYDTDLDITWLADANYAKTSGYDADGYMDWDTANTWAANLSFVDAVNNLTYDNWRLPTVIDTGTPGCTIAIDCGANIDTATGEMAHLFYDELGNKGYNDPGWGGLLNRGPFTNLQGDFYWYGTEYAPDTNAAWFFYFIYGSQQEYYKNNGFYALAVSPGDVGVVPEAQTYALMLAGLGLIGWRARRRE